MKSWKYRIVVLQFIIVVLISGCTTTKVVTYEVIEIIGPGLFSSFRFHLSTNITLREIVYLGGNLEQTGPGVITVSNVELRFNRSIIGLFYRKVPPGRMEIFFEELPDGTRPTLAFVYDMEGESGRYYLETMWGEGFVVDPAGTYGYVRMQGYIVMYNGRPYFLSFTGNQKPYLVMQLNVNVRQDQRIVRGMR